MLLRKSWWETRWGLLILITTALLLCGVGQLWKQPDLSQWISSLQEKAPMWDEESRRLLPLLSSHYGYVWLHWYRGTLLAVWPIYAVTLAATLAASSCPWVAGGQGAAGLSTFSLPVSRRRVLLTHASLVAAEMVFVALALSLMFPIASSLMGGNVTVGIAIIYALLLSLGGMVFISLTFLLVAVFNSPLKAMAVGIGVVFGLFFPFGQNSVEDFPRWHIYHLMAGEAYFRYGQIPWFGLLASFTVSALIMSAAVLIYERRDI